YRCDGTNDEVQISAAIAALLLGATIGGQVVLSEGTFTLGAAIDILRKNVYLHGLGHDVTTLDFSAANAIELTNDVANLTISDLTFQGNAASVYAIKQTDTDNAADIAIVRCNFLKCGSGGVYLAGTTNEGVSRVIIYHNEFKECGGTAGQVEIVGDTPNGGIVIAMNFFYDGTVRPVRCTPADGIIALNHFRDNTGTGPNVSGTEFAHNRAVNSVGEDYTFDSEHGAGSDTDAIHDNVSAEISAITAKGTPIGADFLVIEDSAASNAKKSMTITALQAILSHDSIAGVSSDDHHAQLHAATHAENQADEIVAEGLGATSVDVSTNLKPNGTGGVEFVDSDHADLANVTSDQHHPQTHTVVSHDTTATGANLTALTNDSDAGTLHNHDGDIATHAAIATAHHTKYTDAEVDTIVATHAAISSAHHVAGSGTGAAFSEFLLIGA
ncbi:hypothetical protein LCGC14_2437900, partial [marine sediment metagenome]